MSTFKLAEDGHTFTYHIQHHHDTAHYWVDNVASQTEVQFLTVGAFPNSQQMDT